MHGTAQQLSLDLQRGVSELSQQLQIPNSRKDEDNPTSVNRKVEWQIGCIRMTEYHLAIKEERTPDPHKNIKLGWEAKPEKVHVESIHIKVSNRRKKFYYDKSESICQWGWRGTGWGHERTWRVEMFYMLTVVRLQDYIWHQCIFPHVNFAPIKKEGWEGSLNVFISPSPPEEWDLVCNPWPQQRETISELLSVTDNQFDNYCGCLISLGPPTDGIFSKGKRRNLLGFLSSNSKSQSISQVPKTKVSVF